MLGRLTSQLQSIGECLLMRADIVGQVLQVYSHEQIEAESAILQPLTFMKICPSSGSTMLKQAQSRQTQRIESMDTTNNCSVKVETCVPS